MADAAFYLFPAGNSGPQPGAGLGLAGLVWDTSMRMHFPISICRCNTESYLMAYIAGQ
jgi:hypothetical protein